MDWIKNKNSYKVENSSKTLVASVTPHYKDYKKVAGVFDAMITTIYPDGAYAIKAIRRVESIRGLKNAKQWAENWLGHIENIQKNGQNFLSNSESLTI